MTNNSLQSVRIGLAAEKLVLSNQSSAQIISRNTTRGIIRQKINVSTPKYPNKFVLVDDEDFKQLAQHKWSATREGRNYYAVRAVKNKKTGRWSTLKMQRQLMQAKKGQEVDHKNGEGLDNQRYNLRFCTGTENKRNRKKPQGCISKFKGVVKRRSKWSARIQKGDKVMYLGVYKSEVDAAKTYDKMAIRLFGEFAKLNFEKELQ